jgi:hypothetical protein
MARSGPDGGGGVFGSMSDYADQQPTFDTGHGKYVPKTSVASIGTVNNLDGLNSLANTLTLNYSAETGHTTSHSTTTAIRYGETMKVSANFPILGSTEVTFTLEDTLSWTKGTSD